MKNDFNAYEDLAARLVARPGPLATPCLVWPGAGSNYGRIRSRGRNKLVHRLAWELATGERIPDDREVLHACDVKPCANIEHLSVDSHLENMQDAVRKGRTCRGERHPLAVLDEQSVQAIRRGLARGERQKDLAELFGVSSGTVNAIAKGKSWEWLS